MEPLITATHQLVYLVCVALIHVVKFQTDCSWDKQQRREGAAMDI